MVVEVTVMMIVIVMISFNGNDGIDEFDSKMVIITKKKRKMTTKETESQ